jgi:hypothetical protein
MKKFLHRIVQRTRGRDTGSAVIDGTGNVLDNVITANDGGNTLNGLEGNDTLDGGAIVCVEAANDAVFEVRLVA